MIVVQRILISAATLFSLAGTGHAQAQQTGTTPPSANVNDMPSWSEFPVPPTNIPTAADIRQKVGETNAKRQQLRTEVRALVWDNNNPDAFATSALTRIDPNFAKAVESPMSVMDIEALANELRRRAAPPPIAN